MTKKQVKEVHIFDQVQKKLEDASKCPVAHIDFSGDGGVFGFHAILVNPRFVILVNQAGILVTNEYLADTNHPDTFEVTGYDSENLFPVCEFDKPISVVLIKSPAGKKFTDCSLTWDQAFYDGENGILEEWPSANLIAANFKDALDTVTLICSLPTLS